MSGKPQMTTVVFAKALVIENIPYTHIPTISSAVWETYEWAGSLGNKASIAGMKLSSFGSTYSATDWIKYSVASNDWNKNKNKKNMTGSTTWKHLLRATNNWTGIKIVSRFKKILLQRQCLIMLTISGKWHAIGSWQSYCHLGVSLFYWFS